MSNESLSILLKLPAQERADLAFALWESLDDEEREAEFDLSSEQLAELERCAAEHDADSSTTIPWDEVRRKLGAHNYCRNVGQASRPSH